MKNEVREPQQSRSIEKKKRIVEAGYELFSEVGYYGTNTAEIAKRADVSTGIVYGYFENKRDILICVLDIYLNKVFEPVLKLIENIKAPVDFRKIMSEVIDSTIETHKKNGKIHEALHSLASTDEAVNSKFIQLEDDITAKIADRFEKAGIIIKNPLERIHLAMDNVQSFSHEYVFDKHEYIDYTIMRELVFDTLVKLFEDA